MMGDTYVPQQLGKGSRTVTLPDPNKGAELQKNATVQAKYKREADNNAKANQTMRNSAAYSGSKETAQLDPLVTAVQQGYLSQADANSIKTAVSNLDMKAFKTVMDTIRDSYSESTKSQNSDQVIRFKNMTGAVVKYLDYVIAYDTNMGNQKVYNDMKKYASNGGFFSKGASEVTQGFDRYVSDTYGYDAAADGAYNMSNLVAGLDISNRTGIESSYKAVGNSLAQLYMAACSFERSGNTTAADNAYKQFNAAYNEAINKLGFANADAAHNLITYNFYDNLYMDSSANADDRKYAAEMRNAVDYNTLIGAVNTESDARHKVVLSSLSSLGGWLPKLRSK